MTDEWKCPICHKKGEISIKSRFIDIDRSKIGFYAKCNQCGYESRYFDTSNEVIDFLFDFKNK